MTNTTTTTTTTTTPAARAFAAWKDGNSVNLWPMATKDNRPSRVRNRITRHLGENPKGLRVFHGPEAKAQAESYLRAMQAHPSFGA